MCELTVIKCDFYKGRLKMYMAPDSAKSFICTIFFFKQQKSTDEWQLCPAADVASFRGKVQLVDHK